MCAFFPRSNKLRSNYNCGYPFTNTHKYIVSQTLKIESNAGILEQFAQYINLKKPMAVGWRASCSALMGLQDEDTHHVLSMVTVSCDPDFTTCSEHTHIFAQVPDSTLASLLKRWTRLPCLLWDRAATAQEKQSEPILAGRGFEVQCPASLIKIKLQDLSARCWERPQPVETNPSCQYWPREMPRSDSVWIYFWCPHLQYVCDFKKY